MSMARKVTKGEYQIGIFNVRKEGRKWIAVATGPGTIGNGSPREFTTLRDAYEGVTGETNARKGINADFTSQGKL